MCSGRLHWSNLLTRLCKLIVGAYIRRQKYVSVMVTKVKGGLGWNGLKDSKQMLRFTGLFLLLCVLYFIVRRFHIEPTLHIDKLVVIAALGLFFRFFLPFGLRQYVLLPAGLLLLGWIVGMPKLVYTTLITGIIIYLLHT